MFLGHFSFSLSISLPSITQKYFGVDGILLVYLSYVFLVEFCMFMTYDYSAHDDRRHDDDDYDEKREKGKVE